MYITGITANSFCSKKAFLKPVAEAASKETVDFTKYSYSIPTGVFPKEAKKTELIEYTPTMPINISEIV